MKSYIESVVSGKQPSYNPGDQGYVALQAQVGLGFSSRFINQQPQIFPHTETASSKKYFKLKTELGT